MCRYAEFLPPVTMSVTSGRVTSDQTAAGSCLAKNILCLKRLCVLMEYLQRTYRATVFAVRSAEWIGSVA